MEEMLNRFGAEGTRRASSYDGNTGPSIAPLATRIECDTSTSDALDSFGDVTARCSNRVIYQLNCLSSAIFSSARLEFQLDSLKHYFAI